MNKPATLEEQALQEAALPDLLRGMDGQAVRTADRWPARRTELAALLETVYGSMPPVRGETRCELLHESVVHPLQGARLRSLRVVPAGGPTFLLRLYLPPGTGPYGLLLHGDGCWHGPGDAVVGLCLARSMAFAQFNRVEVAPDPPGHPPRMASAPGQPAALAWWAWAHHRAIDALLQTGDIHPGRIAVVGHSRGGKAALLAGATDERIALTSANNSGAGGAGCWRWRGPGAESLGDVCERFPHWFAPELGRFAGRESDLLLDQHTLKALIAPRALLTTEALDDAWANPLGSWLTHQAARTVYRLLGAEDRIALAWRRGGHAHTEADWRALLDFCDCLFCGSPRDPAWDASPWTQPV
ncbi:MAG: hypothetical protein FGM55_00380 [Rhodoferax sp.]|nr:hypothetical protein [Rhodoferax sp.]